jgi:hypothetical protein
LDCSPGVGRIDEKANNGRIREQLVQQLQSLRTDLVYQRGDTG